MSVRPRPFIAFLTLVLVTAGCTHTKPPVGRTPSNVRGQIALGDPDVLEFGVITEHRAWIVTSRGIFMTRDTGATWKSAGPAGERPDTIIDVFFLDARRGWVALRARATTDADPNGERGAGVRILRTSDAGAHWEAAVGLGRASPPGSGENGWIRFVSSSRGWYSYREASNRGFGGLLRTLDGGRSWKALELPIGDPTVWVNDHLGWTAGGAAHDELWSTDDAGTTWVRRRLPVNTRESYRTIGVPVLAGGETWLPLTFPGDQDIGTPAVLEIDRWQAKTRRWVPVAKLTGLPPGGFGSAPSLSLTRSDTWLANMRGSNDLWLSPDRAGAWKRLRLPFTDVVDVWAASAVVWWVQTVNDGCLNSDCTEAWVLYVTTDAGAHWRSIST